MGKHLDIPFSLNRGLSAFPFRTLTALMTLGWMGLNPAAAAPYLYLMGENNTGTNDIISMIDLDTNQTILQFDIPHKTQGSRDMILSPDNRRLYLTSTVTLDVGRLTVFDAVTHAEIQRLDLLTGIPKGLAVHPDGSRLYIGQSDTSIAVVDTATFTVTQVDLQPLPPNTRLFFPVDVKISPDGSRLYVSGNDAGILVIDTATNTAIRQITGFNAMELAVHPDGTKIYATDSNIPTQVAVFNPATGEQLALTALTETRNGLALSPDGSRVFVSTLDARIHILDGTTLQTIATVQQDQFQGADAMVPDPDGKILYAANRIAADATVIDTLNAVPVRRFELPDSPVAIAFRPGEPPVPLLSPTQVDFGELPIGSTSAPVDVALRNLGQSDLSITAIESTGPYRLEHDCGDTLAAQGGCVLSVSFQPTTNVLQTGEVTIRYAGTEAAQTLTLTGTGTETAASPPDTADPGNGSGGNSNPDTGANNDSGGGGGFWGLLGLVMLLARRTLLTGGHRR